MIQAVMYSKFNNRDRHASITKYDITKDKATVTTSFKDVLDNVDGNAIVTATTVATTIANAEPTLLWEAQIRKNHLMYLKGVRK